MAWVRRVMLWGAAIQFVCVRPMTLGQEHRLHRQN